MTVQNYTVRLRRSKFAQGLDAKQIVSRLRYATGRSKYFFIHIPKCAGSSIRKSKEVRSITVFGDPAFLKSKEYFSAFYKTAIENDWPLGPQHARLIDWSPKVRETLKGFAIVRNPWSRTLSRYTYKCLTEQTLPTKAGFKRFIDDRHMYMELPFVWHRASINWTPQNDYVVNEHGLIAVDCLRHESLDIELPTYLGISAIGHINGSKPQDLDWRDFFDHRTIQTIGDVFKKDLEMFGFDFDSYATRNVVFT